MIEIGSVALSGPRIILLILFVPLIIDLLTGKLGKTYPVDYLFITFISWTAFAFTVNNPNRVVEHVGSTGIEFLGSYLLGRAYIRTPQAFQSMIKVGVIVILISLPFGILEMKTGVAFWPSIFRNLPGFNAWADVANPPRMGLERAQIFFPHPIHQGLFCSLFVSLILIGLRDRASLLKRLFMSAIVGGGVFMGLSAAPLLSMILQLSLISWAFVFRNHPMRWWYLIFLFVCMYVTIDLISNRTPVKVLMSYATFSPQTAYYRAVINEWGYFNVSQNPIFGLGMRDWVRPAYMQRGSVDNFWLVTAMRYGIPGIVILALGYADAMFRVGLAKTREGTPAHNIRQAWTIAIVSLAFVLYTVHVWTSVYSFIFMRIGAGLWIPQWADKQKIYSGSVDGEVNPAAGQLSVGIAYSRAGVGLIGSWVGESLPTSRISETAKSRRKSAVLSRNISTHILQVSR